MDALNEWIMWGLRIGCALVAGNRIAVKKWNQAWKWLVLALLFNILANL